METGFSYSLTEGLTTELVQETRNSNLRMGSCGSLAASASTERHRRRQRKLLAGKRTKKNLLLAFIN